MEQTGGGYLQYRVDAGCGGRAVLLQSGPERTSSCCLRRTVETRACSLAGGAGVPLIV